MKTNGRFAISRAVKLAAGAAVLTLLAACELIPPAQPDLTRYYVLGAEAKSDGAPAARPVRVALRPVEVPQFLHGRIIEVRVGPNEVRYVDEAHWAEPLDAGVTHVLRDNLAAHAGLALTARGEAHDYEIVVRVRQCEGVVASGVARFEARVEIYSTELDPKVVAQDDFATEVAGWDGKDYGALTKKLSEAIARLADRVATLVRGQ